MSEDRQSWMAWFGLRDDADPRDLQWLGPPIAILLGLFFLLWLVLTLYIAGGLFFSIADVIFDGLPINPDTGKPDRWPLVTITALTATLGALVAFPFTILRVRFNARQTKATEEGLITDRINKAVEGLGAEKTIQRQMLSEIGEQLYYIRNDVLPGGRTPIFETLTLPNLEVRIGALYSLERISQDSERDHIQIMEILCAYVRENAPCSHLDPTEPPFDRAKPRIDIQTAITVLGRRSFERIKMEQRQKFRLNLSRCNLDGIDFSNGDFSAANLDRSRLEACSFRAANFAGCRLRQTLMNFAEFWNCNFLGAQMDGCQISMPKEGSFSSSSLGRAQTKGLSLVGADISACRYLGTIDQMNELFWCNDTIIHERYNKRRPDYLALESNADRGIDGDHEPVSGDDVAVAKGFKWWVPYSAHDLALPEVRDAFLKEMGLWEWPFKE